MANGWWNDNGAISGCDIAYQPIGAASLAASYSNLVNPGTYDAAPGTAPTWASGTGWTFNGSTQYLTTGYTPGSSGTVIVRVASLTNNASFFGCERTTSGSYLFIYRHSSSGIQYANVDGASGYKTPAASSGVFGVAGRTMYRNGSAESGALGTALTMDRTLIVGARGNSSGTIIEFMAGNIVAFVAYSGTLTSGQMSTVMTYMTNLPTLPTWASSIDPTVTLPGLGLRMY